MKEKDLLSAIFVADLKKGKASLSELSLMLEMPVGELAASLARLKDDGQLKSNGKAFELTSRGRQKLKVVFIGGTFEVIHAGHLYTMQEAKKRGDLLVVVVARDATIRRRKKREPIAPEKERVRVVSAMRPVDAAILGSETNIYDTLELVGPDVVALGYDQYHTEAEIIREAKGRGMEISVVRLDSPFPTLKTSKILAGL